MQLGKVVDGVAIGPDLGATVAAGTIGMIRYQMKLDAPLPTAPRQFPLTAIADVPLDKARPTLVAIFHPQCPCSRASMHELGELMSRAHGRFAAFALFVKPDHAPADWLDCDLWRQAKAIPDLNVSVDEGGKDALALGAVSSGEVLVYDTQHRLLFSGGITNGRGHEGDNPGYLVILALLREGSSTTATTPVYGCSLGVCKTSEHKAD